MLDRMWRPCCMACSITRLKPPGFLFVGASEKHCAHWACSCCSDPSTRIHVACYAIWEQPGTFERVRQSMMWRVHACIASHGGHFEHLLWHRWDSDHVLCAKALWCCSTVPSTTETMHFGHKMIWTFMLHFQSGIIPWSLLVDLKLTLYILCDQLKQQS